MKSLYIIAVSSVLFSSAAFAGGSPDYPGVIERGIFEGFKEIPTVIPWVSDRTPWSTRNANESPIMGKGRISVMHNEPPPKEESNNSSRSQ